ncbi:hypothetical protein ACFE04_005213 [Oxalis oulophora]
MFFHWRRRKQSSSIANKRKNPTMEKLVINIPTHFKCPISLDLMKDPVTLSSGITYDRDSIEKWLETGNQLTCPLTNQLLRNFDEIPNHTLRRMIQDWCVENRNNGVERIPTPRVPVSSMEVMETVNTVEVAANRLDSIGCFEMVKKINKWGIESERNKKCIAQSRAAHVLAYAFAKFSVDFNERNENLLEEILSAFQWINPTEEEAPLYLTMAASFSCMVSLLKSENLSTKQNTIFVLKELLCVDDPKSAQALSSINGVDEILINFVRNPISNSITKASLMVIFHLISHDDKTKSELIKMGLVSTLIENIIMYPNHKGLSERALRVFDKLCDCTQGRDKAYDNDLTIPLLVKKILRVSELATEYSVSSIWKLCKFSSSHECGEKSLVEALQAGCFQKLLLVLQVGCGDDTKEKTTELMKLLNPYMNGFECIETSDFKNLKRSF